VEGLDFIENMVLLLGKVIDYDSCLHVHKLKYHTSEHV